MQTSSLFGMMDALIIVCALYVIYIAISTKTSGVIKENSLLPKGLEVRKCKDPAGYIAYIWSKQMILGVVALIGGIIGVLEDMKGIIGPIGYLGSICVVVAVLVWYGISSKKAIARYW